MAHREIIVPRGLFAGPVLPIRKNKSPGFEFKAASADAADLYLYESIGAGWDEGITAKQFSTDLKALGQIKTLNIYINSPGGSVFDGVGIFNVLKRHRAEKIVTIDGIAASIASVIAMAGDEIRIATNGMFMVHDPWAMAIGSAADMRKMADSLDKVRDAILTTYEDRTTTDRETLQQWMADETWMSAQEAVDAGFADSIVEEVAIAALAKHDLSTFRHVPEPLAKAAEQAKAEGENSDNTDKQVSQIGAEVHSRIASLELRARKARSKQTA